jgi:histidinol-phosphate aminotransferase
MPTLRLLPHIEALPNMVPFVAPEAVERRRGRRFRARLGANESPFGPSPKAAAAMREAAASVWRYGDPESWDLKAALASRHGVQPQNIIVGEGIDGLQGLTARLTLQPGDAAVTSAGAYPTFNYHVAAQGGRLVAAPYKDDREDLEALLDLARREKARLLYVSNPDNPMGSWWSAAHIERLLEQLPPGVLFMLDEAYCQYAPAEAALPPGLLHPQMLRFRTFSKAYGLAGARVGYALGEPGLIAAFDKMRNHFGVNRIGQIGALAALEDQEHLTQAVEKIFFARRRLARIATDNGLEPLPSAANFVAIDCGRDGAFALRVMEALTDRDVFVRKPMTPPLDRCIRVSCGLDADLDVFAEELGPALRAAAD